MSLVFFIGSFLCLQLVTGLQSPCTFKNVTIMSAISQRPIVTPTNCGNVYVNESEFSNPPNVIVHGSKTGGPIKYTMMLLKTVKGVYDGFELVWLLSNISPLHDSVTSNLTRSEFMRFRAPHNSEITRYFLYVYSQNGTVSIGIGHNEPFFFPQKWVSLNKNINRLVGGAEFSMTPAKNQNTSVTPQQSWPVPQYPAQYPPSPQQPQYPAQYPPSPQQYPPPPPVYYPAPPPIHYSTPQVYHNHSKMKSFAAANVPHMSIVCTVLAAIRFL